MQDLKVTIIQSDLVWENKDANIKSFENKIRNIKEETDLIVLPEMFNTAFSMKPEIFAEKPDGETFFWLKRISCEINTPIAGSYMVKENGKYYNRFIIMYSDGKYKTYDKRHLFRMGNEQDHFSAGKDQLIFELKGWKIKALICYDLRFPVFSKNNFSNNTYDYDALIYVANWPKARNHIWKSLLLARALENQCYVIGVNRIGEDGNGLDHAGSSCIINPKGEFLINENDNNEFIKTVDLSYYDLYDFRNKFTVGLDWDQFEIIN